LLWYDIKDWCTRDHLRADDGPSLGCGEYHSIRLIWQTAFVKPVGGVRQRCTGTLSSRQPATSGVTAFIAGTMLDRAPWWNLTSLARICAIIYIGIDSACRCGARTSRTILLMCSVFV